MRAKLQIQQKILSAIHDVEKKKMLSKTIGFANRNHSRVSFGRPKIVKLFKLSPPTGTFYTMVQLISAELFRMLLTRAGIKQNPAPARFNTAQSALKY